MKRRSALSIMGSLVGLVKPLLHIMSAAVFLGTAGYLCAIFLTILAGQVMVHGLLDGAADAVVPVKNMRLVSVPAGTILAAMVVIAVLRGIFHYAEQYCNHFIAFKLLAIIRHKVFSALRKLCPAKLEGRDKGNLISIITTDIELLEVFYAHTISPIAIAVLTSAVMVIFIGRYHMFAGLLALAAYLAVGIAIPMWNGSKGSEKGMEFRTEFGELNSFVLDSLRGLDETLQFGQGEIRKEQMSRRSKNLAEMQEDLSRMEGRQRSITNLVILLASYGMLALTVRLYTKGEIGFEGLLTCTIAMMGSFGPVVALSSLSNNLNQTLASGERVLSLLEEKPLVEEIAESADTAENESIAECADAAGNMKAEFAGAKAEHVTFAYQEEMILQDYSIRFEPGKITGIHGASGSGKSTLLKLLMRFWNAKEGKITVDGKNVNETPTKHLRDMESYVTQETHLFHDSIANNISGGERQRIGIARAFLHDAPLILLDEPTSNLDSLNEGIILKSLKESAEEKTVVLVSHRKSTMNVADVVYEMDGV